MFCKNTQNTINTLLRLKVDDNNNKPTVNLIGSYEDSIIVQPKNKNKNKTIGEVRELQSLIKPKGYQILKLS